MAAKYPKVRGTCIICGQEALLYQSPESSGYRDWCSTCFQRYELLVKYRNDASVNSAELLRLMMAKHGARADDDQSD